MNHHHQQQLGNHILGRFCWLCLFYSWQIWPNISQSNDTIPLFRPRKPSKSRSWQAGSLRRKHPSALSLTSSYSFDDFRPPWIRRPTGDHVFKGYFCVNIGQYCYATMPKEMQARPHRISGLARLDPFWFSLPLIGVLSDACGVEEL